MILDYPRKENGMYYIKRDQLDDIAGSLLSEYAPDVLVEPQPLKIGEIVEEQLGLTLQYQYLTPNGAISGLIAFGDNDVKCYDDMFRPIELPVTDGTILIDKTLSGDKQLPRRRYTITHEFSHRILHRSYYDPENRHFSFRESRNRFIACRSADIERSNEPRVIDTDHGWKEWQADGLAAALLMPRSPFTSAAKRIIHNRTRRYFISELTTRAERWDIVNCLAEVFMVSKQAAAIRLKYLNLMNYELTI